MANKLGKIDSSAFQSIIAGRCGYMRTDLVAPASFGVDVAVVDLGNGISMALTSDPLSLIPSLGLRESAWLSVHILANDMATTGFAPQYAQMVLNLPPSLSPDDFSTYWRYIHEFCSEIGITITGGHTGFIEGQNSTIAGGATFITIAPTQQIILSSGAQEGDVILMTKTAAMVSTAILALSFPQTIRERLGNEVYHQVSDLFYQTSSLREALVARQIPQAITAMHDVTEGGILGAVYELASASNKGCRIYYDAIPVLPAQRELCKLFHLDPTRIIGAGSMLMTCRPHKVQEVIDALDQVNIRCTIIGEILPDPQEKLLLQDNQLQPLIYQETDPYWAAFFHAFTQGWK
ncbi:MAG TPA: AIR synthase family protein [Bacteroidales bacterium]|nr:AIR synthase family protein [Bacteroidales bacterium]